MHLLESIVHRRSRTRSIRVGRHNTNDAAPAGVQTSSNDAQHDVLAREDTSDARKVDSTAWSGSGCFHDADSRRTLLFHELGDFLDGGLGSYGGRLGAGVHHGREVGKGSLLAECFDIRKHRCRLRVRGNAAAKLGLNTGQRVVELLRRGRAALDLVESLVKDLGDVEQTDNIAFFVTHGLMVIGECV